MLIPRKVPKAAPVATDALPAEAEKPEVGKMENGEATNGEAKSEEVPMETEDKIAYVLNMYLSRQFRLNLLIPCSLQIEYKYTFIFYREQTPQEVSRFYQMQLQNDNTFLTQATVI